MVRCPSIPRLSLVNRNLFTYLPRFEISPRDLPHGAEFAHVATPHGEVCSGCVRREMAWFSGRFSAVRCRMVRRLIYHIADGGSNSAELA